MLTLHVNFTTLRAFRTQEADSDVNVLLDILSHMAESVAELTLDFVFDVSLRRDRHDVPDDMVRSICWAELDDLLYVRKQLRSLTITSSDTFTNLARGVHPSRIQAEWVEEHMPRLKARDVLHCTWQSAQ